MVDCQTLISLNHKIQIIKFNFQNINSMIQKLKNFFRSKNDYILIQKKILENNFSKCLSLINKICYKLLYDILILHSIVNDTHDSQRIPQQFELLTKINLLISYINTYNYPNSDLDQITEKDLQITENFPESKQFIYFLQQINLWKIVNQIQREFFSKQLDSHINKNINQQLQMDKVKNLNKHLDKISKQKNIKIQIDEQFNQDIKQLQMHNDHILKILKGFFKNKFTKQLIQKSPNTKQKQQPLYLQDKLNVKNNYYDCFDIDQEEYYQKQAMIKYQFMTKELQKSRNQFLIGQFLKNFRLKLSIIRYIYQSNSQCDYQLYDFQIVDIRNCFINSYKEYKNIFFKRQKLLRNQESVNLSKTHSHIQNLIDTKYSKQSNQQYTKSQAHSALQKIVQQNDKNKNSLSLAQAQSQPLLQQNFSIHKRQIYLSQNFDNISLNQNNSMEILNCDVHQILQPKKQTQNPIICLQKKNKIYIKNMSTFNHIKKIQNEQMNKTEFESRQPKEDIDQNFYLKKNDQRKLPLKQKEILVPKISIEVQEIFQPPQEIFRKSSATCTLQQTCKQQQQNCSKQNRQLLKSSNQSNQLQRDIEVSQSGKISFKKSNAFKQYDSSDRVQQYRLLQNPYLLQDSFQSFIKSPIFQNRKVQVRTQTKQNSDFF